MPTLEQLSLRQRGLVEAIEGTDVIVQRLMEMGLIEGEEVEVVAYAPLGDPIEILLRGFHLTLRRSEAARIQVRVLEPSS